MTSPSAFASFSRFSEDCLDFFAWWKSEMLRMLPRGKTRSHQRDRLRVVIGKAGFSLDGDVFQPLSGLGETLRTLKSTGDFEGDAIGLVLDEPQYLERVISHRRLPLSMLKRAAELDVLTETPFRLEDIRILLSAGQNRGSTYFILRRDFVDEMRAQFRQAQVGVSGIYLGAEQLEVVSGLTPADFSGVPRRSMRKILNYLFPFSILLACLFCAYQIQQKTSAAAETLDAQIDEASKKAHAARARYDEYVRKSKQLHALKQSQKLEVVTAWEELSRILPDTAFLTDLTLAE